MVQVAKDGLYATLHGEFQSWSMACTVHVSTVGPYLGDSREDARGMVGRDPEFLNAAGLWVRPVNRRGL